MVEIGLNRSVYRVFEGKGEVRVTVESVGSLEKKVRVLLSTKEGSAKGERQNYYYSIQQLLLCLDFMVNHFCRVCGLFWVL